MPTNVPGISPYQVDDTRRWVESFRVGNKIKPTVVFRAATDSNYLHNESLQLPAYGGRYVETRSVCNIVSPGQRLPGVLSWEVTESLENLQQTAQLTILDALGISKISSTITGFGVGHKNGTFYGQSSLPAQWHSTIIQSQWVRNGFGVSTRLDGNRPIDSFHDATLNQNTGYNQNYREDNLDYRQFEPDILIGDFSNFPNPAVPQAENEGNSDWWEVDTTATQGGVGAYYVLIDQEVIRVTGIQRNTRPQMDYLFVPPGGRGAAGYITNHSIGASITLLGFPPYTGKWAGFGYLMPKDFKINRSPFRPGTCWVSYEGYGVPGQYKDPPTGYNLKLIKYFVRNNNMNFTGYWFTNSPQLTLDDTGVPSLTVTFQSPGFVLSEQKIDPNNISRAKGAFHNWAKATFDQIGHERKIPGDWYDYNMWDPTLPGAYPLTISTMYAQHKAFFDHMTNTDFGRQCQYCQEEWLAYITKNNTRAPKPTGSIPETRAVGKHIYLESIRVFNKGGQFNAGPLKTFGRLMHALALAAWEHPQEGNELGSRWTKIPNALFENLQNFQNGRCWNGQLGYDFDGDRKYDWSNQTHGDKEVYGSRLPLKCGFTSEYDRQPWSQPMQDLADLNRMTYTINRLGYPVFAPMNMKLRGMKASGAANSQTPKGWFVDSVGFETADGDDGAGEWHLSYGASIDSYTHTIDPSSVLTLVYVSCQTAFGDEITFTIPAAGTGIVANNTTNEDSSDRTVVYSWKVGNKEGLQLTSGAQQTDAVSLDNVLLGLDWNTEPASWGLTLQRGDGNLTQVDAQPPVPNPGGSKLRENDSYTRSHSGLVRKLQRLINFMLERRYVGPAVYDDKGHTVYALQINETGKFDKPTLSGVKNIQRFLASQEGVGFKTYNSDSGVKLPHDLNAPISIDRTKQDINPQDLSVNVAVWTGPLSDISGADSYDTQSGANRIDTSKQSHTSGTQYGDPLGVWGFASYYAMRTWLRINAEYIKTDVWWYVQNGLPWDQYIGAITGMPIPQRRDDQDTSKWIIDQQALKIEGENWMKQFFLDGVHYGCAIVDDSINKATTKVINTNLADPRIELGDIIWANVPGYLTTKNAFGNDFAPFLHGIYVTGITRTMDLRQGTYSGSYEGYRYRGNFVKTKGSTNPNNYCSIKTKV